MIIFIYFNTTTVFAIDFFCTMPGKSFYKEYDVLRADAEIRNARIALISHYKKIVDFALIFQFKPKMHVFTLGLHYKPKLHVLALILHSKLNTNVFAY